MTGVYSSQYSCRTQDEHFGRRIKNTMMDQIHSREGETEEQVATTSGMEGTVQRLRDLRIADRKYDALTCTMHVHIEIDAYLLIMIVYTHHRIRRKVKSFSACRLTLDEKVELALSVAEECINVTELRNLLDKKPNPIAYDGFEPSGRMHIAQVGNECPSFAVMPFNANRTIHNTHCTWPGGVQNRLDSCLVTHCMATLQGVMKALNVNKLTKCGVTFKFW